MNIYATIPGVTGMATDINHKGQIPVKSYTFRKSRNVDMKVGYGSNREGGSQSFSYFELVKQIDKSSPQLYQLFATGKSLDKVVIQVCRTGTGAEVYHEFTLYNVMMAGRELANIADSGMHTGLEHLTLAYTRLDEKFIPYDGQNKVGTPVMVGFDLETAKAC